MQIFRLNYFVFFELLVLIIFYGVMFRVFVKKILNGARYV